MVDIRYHVLFGTTFEMIKYHKAEQLKHQHFVELMGLCNYGIYMNYERGGF